MKTQFKRTNKVTAENSLTTSKILVKMSGVAYGYIDGSTLVIDRKPTQMVLHSLEVFAQKNTLTIRHA